MRYERQRRYSLLAWGNAPGLVEPKAHSAEGAIQSIGAPRSIPDITLIKIDTVFAQ